MSQFPNYIVLATDPKDIQDPAFTEGHYQYCEWSIYDGVKGLDQAEFYASRLRELFQEVQIRIVGNLADTYKKVGV